jgi:hypothetical protein
MGLHSTRTAVLVDDEMVRLVDYFGLIMARSHQERKTEKQQRQGGLVVAPWTKTRSGPTWADPWC